MLKTDEKEMRLIRSESSYTGLKSRTKGMITPDGKPRVFFCCHPADFDTYFLRISDEILDRHRNCAIWYREEQSAAVEEDWEDLKFELRDMQLVVFPVTKIFLREKNFAREEILPFVKRHNISVLPIIFDETLTEEFDRVCGNFQCLVCRQQDHTGMEFRRMLERFLTGVLCDDVMAKKIHSIWDFKIFLSYRKKDRAYARELMKLIHDSKYCRDVAIWYDEYLTPGENYNKEIEEKIRSCDMFIMIVTPNILEENNYVRRIEYPIAKGAGTYMCSVEMVSTDREAFLAEYEENSDRILVVRNKAKFKKALDEIVIDMMAGKCGMTGKAYEEKSESTWDRWMSLPPQPDSEEMMQLFADMDELRHVSRRIPGKDKKTRYETYLLGLAYLNGIDVEVDQERGIALIQKAANKGEVQASRKLVNMYLYGRGVEQDLEKAEALQKKSADYWERRVSKKASQENMITWIDELLGLAEIYDATDRDDAAETLYLETAYALEDGRSCLDEYTWLLKKAELDNKLAYCTLKRDEHNIGEFEESLQTYYRIINDHVRMSESEYAELWRTHIRIAKAYRLGSNDDEKTAVQCLMAGIDAFEQAIEDICPDILDEIRLDTKKADISEFTENVELTQALLKYHALLKFFLADILTFMDIDGKEEKVECALREGIADYEQTGLEASGTWDYEQAGLLEAYVHYAIICSQSGRAKLAEEKIVIGLEIGEMLISEHMSVIFFYHLCEGYLAYARITGKLDAAKQKIDALLSVRFGKTPDMCKQLQEVFDSRLEKMV